jgi:hypothetical protein
MRTHMHACMRMCVCVYSIRPATAPAAQRPIPIGSATAPVLRAAATSNQQPAVPTVRARLAGLSVGPSSATCGPRQCVRPTAAVWPMAACGPWQRCGPRQRCGPWQRVVHGSGVAHGSGAAHGSVWSMAAVRPTAAVWLTAACGPRNRCDPRKRVAHGSVRPTAAQRARHAEGHVVREREVEVDQHLPTRPSVVARPRTMLHVVRTHRNTGRTRTQNARAHTANVRVSARGGVGWVRGGGGGGG